MDRVNRTLEKDYTSMKLSAVKWVDVDMSKKIADCLTESETSSTLLFEQENTLLTLTESYSCF